MIIAKDVLLESLYENALTQLKTLFLNLINNVTMTCVLYILSCVQDHVINNLMCMFEMKNLCVFEHVILFKTNKKSS